MRKVLLIEDDALLCWLLEKILKNKYDVTVMNDGKTAWEWLSKDNIPDLIVSDLKMPSLGGIELLENLNSHDTLKTIPVIIHSGFEDSGKRKKCLELGAFAYLVKPFEPEYLVSEVERAIESRNENILAGK
ncbi:MAG TPA: response regulator [Chryseolinea sp.]|nr:response regulator [Chryseolinea sp.]